MSFVLNDSTGPLPSCTKKTIATKYGCCFFQFLQVVFSDPMAPLSVRKKYPCEIQGKHCVGCDKLIVCPMGYDHPGVCIKIPQIVSARTADPTLKFLKKYKIDLELCKQIIALAQEAGVNDLDGLVSELFQMHPVEQQQGPPPSLAPYFTILGVPPTASADEIKKAFRIGQIKHHPDRGGDKEKFHELTQAFKMVNGPISAPDRQDKLGAKVMLEQQKVFAIPFHADKFVDHDALLFAYIDLLHCLDPYGNIDAELYGCSDKFRHPYGTEWLAHLIMTVGAYRFNPMKRLAGLEIGAPLTLDEMKKFQRNAFESGGVVSIFMQYDPDAASDNLSKRNNSCGWRGLCSLFGQEINTSEFKFYVDGYRRANCTDRKRKMKDELAPEFDERGFKRFATEMLRKHDVWPGVNTDGVAWEIAFESLTSQANKLLANGHEGPSAMVH